MGGVWGGVVAHVEISIGTAVYCGWIVVGSGEPLPAAHQQDPNKRYITFRTLDRLDPFSPATDVELLLGPHREPKKQLVCKAVELL